MKPSERFQRLLEKLGQVEVPVIVEGTRDAKALGGFGIITNVITLSGRSLHEIASSLAHQGIRRAIVLTDVDKKGELLARNLCQLLLNESIKADMSYRKRLRGFGVVCIEDTPNILAMLKKREKGENNGKNIHRHG